MDAQTRSERSCFVALTWNTRFTSTLIEFALLKVHLSFLLSRHLEGKLAADAKLTHKDIFLSGKDRVPSTRIHTVFSFCILYHYTSIFTGKVIFILYVLLKYLNFRAKNGYTQIVLLIFDTKISVARFSRNISKWDFLRDFQIISEWVSNQIRQCERSRKSSEEEEDGAATSCGPFSIHASASRRRSKQVLLLLLSPFSLSPARRTQRWMVPVSLDPGKRTLSYLSIFCPFN